MKKIYKFLILSIFFVVTSNATSDQSLILKRNIFSAPVPPPPPAPKDIVKTSILRPTPLPELSSLLELRGIVYLKENYSRAIIFLKKKNEELVFSEGDFFEEAELVSIEENQVFFDYGGKKTSLKLIQPDKGGLIEVVPGVGVNAKVNPQQVNIPYIQESQQAINFNEPVNEQIVVHFDTAVREMMNEPETIKNLNISPSIQDGKISGFKVTNIPPDSQLIKYGLENGDIIKKVNGTLIDSVARGYAVYNQITRERAEIVTVEILRKNTPKTFTFKLR